MGFEVITKPGNKEIEEKSETKTEVETQPEDETLSKDGSCP
jgi:hypothetical protein